MALEKKNGGEVVSRALRQKALKEMHDSGKPLPFEGTPEQNLSAAIRGHKKHLTSLWIREILFSRLKNK